MFVPIFKYHIAFGVILSTIFLICPSQKSKSNRLIFEYLNQQRHTYQLTENDALNDYIDEYDEYYTDNDDNDIYNYYMSHDSETHDINNHDLDTEFEDIQSYLEAPGYTVKMNENAFRAYLSVLLDLYGLKNPPKENRDPKNEWNFGDGRSAIENLRNALKDEARYFFKRPISSIGGIIKRRWHVYKWDVAKFLAHEIPVVGTVLKIAISVIQFEPAVRRFIVDLSNNIRRATCGWVALDETVQFCLEKPYALYVLRHWKPIEEDKHSIHNIRLECPLKERKKPSDIDTHIKVELDKYPGKCVWKRKDGSIVDNKSQRWKGFARKVGDWNSLKQCIGAGDNYYECDRLIGIGNHRCHWQYCDCTPLSLFEGVVTCDKMFCLSMEKDECIANELCHWS